VSLPRATGQVPVYYNHKNSGRPLGPSQISGHFLSRYVDAPTTPLFPFGHGLAYTRFEYGAVQISGDTLRGSLEISAQVANTGPRAGLEVAQFYVRDLVGSLTRPVRELKDFQRLSLAPGESRRVSFTITEEQLAFTRADGTHGVEPGRFQTWVSRDCTSGAPVEFRL
jgi:beta-glucosidase